MQDEAVQRTNDDATQSKAACVALGYFKDDFVRYFVRRPVKKPPLINRGYYARQQCITLLRNQFMEAIRAGGADCQVLSLGAGYDTTYFQLKSEGKTFSKYVELDFDEVVCRKTMAISSKEGLRAVAEDRNPLEFDKSSGALLSKEYCVLPADLRDPSQVEAVIDRCGIDLKAPTFILAECVLVYMRPEESDALLQQLAQKFGTSVILVYEQFKPDTMFGRQMIRNLEERGAPLYGVRATPTLEAHKERLTRCGWQRASSADLLRLYGEMLDPVDRRRIESLEMFDEFEEWNLIMTHYCITVAVSDDAGLLGSYDFQLMAADETQTEAPFGRRLPVVD